MSDYVITDEDCQFLSRICYFNEQFSRVVNHIAVEVGSPDHIRALKLEGLQVIKSAGPESKTSIKRFKLDPTKNWTTFYIGYAVGHRALEAYNERNANNPLFAV